MKILFFNLSFDFLLNTLSCRNMRIYVLITAVVWGAGPDEQDLKSAGQLAKSRGQSKEGRVSVSSAVRSILDEDKNNVYLGYDEMVVKIRKLVPDLDQSKKSSIQSTIGMIKQERVGIGASWRRPPSPERNFKKIEYAPKVTVKSAMKTVFSEHPEFIGLPNNILIPMIQDQFVSDDRPSYKSVQHALAIERRERFGPRNRMSNERDVNLRSHLGMAKKLLKEDRTRTNEEIANTIIDALVKDRQQVPVLRLLKRTVTRARREVAHETGEDFSARKSHKIKAI